MGNEFSVSGSSYSYCSSRVCFRLGSEHRICTLCPVQTYLPCRAGEHCLKHLQLRSHTALSSKLPRFPPVLSNFSVLGEETLPTLINTTEKKKIDILIIAT